MVSNINLLEAHQYEDESNNAMQIMNKIKKSQKELGDKVINYMVLKVPITRKVIFNEWKSARNANEHTTMKAREDYYKGASHLKQPGQKTLEYDAHTTKEPNQHSSWKPSQTSTM
jgi:hypothetical protein